MAHDINFATLRLFVAVCEEMSIARAAERQAIVASAVSRRIAAVEEDIGVPLLVRGRRGIKPTVAGEAMLRQAREVIRAMDRLKTELNDFASGVHCYIRVVAAPAVLAGNLPEDLGTFLEKAPGVSVSTDERPSPEVLRAVREGAAEIGILWGTADLSDFDVNAYRGDHLCLALRSDHPMAGRSSVRFEEVLDEVSIVVAPGGMLDTMLRREAARLSRTLSYRVEVSGLDVAARFVAAGLGIAVLPHQGALGHSKARSLVFVPLSDPWAKRQYFIITRKGLARSSTMSLLIDHLQTQALNAPDP
jgi:DNA-binding transcriptional LysR family regulator